MRDSDFQIAISPPPDTIWMWYLHGAVNWFPWKSMVKVIKIRYTIIHTWKTTNLEISACAKYDHARLMLMLIQISHSHIIRSDQCDFWRICDGQHLLHTKWRYCCCCCWNRENLEFSKKVDLKNVTRMTKENITIKWQALATDGSFYMPPMPINSHTWRWRCECEAASHLRHNW